MHFCNDCIVAWCIGCFKGIWHRIYFIQKRWNVVMDDRSILFELLTLNFRMFTICHLFDFLMANRHIRIVDSKRMEFVFVIFVSRINWWLVWLLIYISLECMRSSIKTSLMSCNENLAKNKWIAFISLWCCMAVLSIHTFNIISIGNNNWKNCCI